MLIIWHIKIEKKKATKKKKPCFTSWQTCQVGSVGRSGDFLYFLFFYFMVPKMTSKTQKFRGNWLWYFLQKNFGKIFRLIFKKFQPFFSDLGLILILQDFAKKKNNLPKRKFGSVAPVKQGFLFSWPNGQY